MAAIYITGITIVMLNIAGIGFVIFLLFFNMSKSQLKKANFEKNTTINDSIQDSLDNFSISDANVDNAGREGIKVVRGTSTSRSKSAAGTAIIGAAAITGTAAAAGAASGNMQKKNEFDNIDDILNDLDLSDFDDLDLDDFT
ncbi:MAG: hypothetical protein HQK67_00375 [Desulfamplus sp.]|nr:hypothetical protein [Desulfamplus sp.]